MQGLPLGKFLGGQSATEGVHRCGSGFESRRLLSRPNRLITMKTQGTGSLARPLVFFHLRRFNHAPAAAPHRRKGARSGPTPSPASSARRAIPGGRWVPATCRRLHPPEGLFRILRGCRASTYPSLSDLVGVPRPIALPLPTEIPILRRYRVGTVGELESYREAELGWSRHG